MIKLPQDSIITQLATDDKSWIKSIVYVRKMPFHAGM